MTAPTGRDAPGRPGPDPLAGVRAVVANVVAALLAEPGPPLPARVAHLRNALNCFPELRDDVAARLRRADRPDDVDAFVDALGPGAPDDAVMAFDWSALASTAAVEAILARVTGGAAAGVAPTDTLVLAASVLLLRHRLAEPAVPPDAEVPAALTAALGDLRRRLPPRPPATAPARPAVRLDDLLARGDGEPDPASGAR